MQILFLFTRTFPLTLTLLPVHLASLSLKLLKMQTSGQINLCRKHSGSMDKIRSEGIHLKHVQMYDLCVYLACVVGFILLYIVYVLVVVLGRYIYQRFKTPDVIGEITVSE